MMFTRVSTSRSHIIMLLTNTYSSFDSSVHGCSEQPNERESHPCRSFTSILRNQQRPAVADFTDLDRDQEQDKEANTPHIADPSHNTKHNDQSHNSHSKMPSHKEQDQKEQHGPTKDPSEASQQREINIDVRLRRSRNPKAVILKRKNQTVPMNVYQH